MKIDKGIILAACLMFISASSNVYAAQTTTPGAKVTITTTEANDNDFEFTPSPTVIAYHNIEDQAFTIGAFSQNNLNNKNGFAFCSASGSNNIYKITLEGKSAFSFTATAGSTMAGFKE